MEAVVHVSQCVSVRECRRFKVMEVPSNSKSESESLCYFPDDLVQLMWGVSPERVVPSGE